MFKNVIFGVLSTLVDFPLSADSSALMSSLAFAIAPLNDCRTSVVALRPSLKTVIDCSSLSKAAATVQRKGIRPSYQRHG